MNLIDLYIQEVTRRLPIKSRQDIALELRSTIEDMLPEDYTEEDVTLVLKKLGNPAVLANGYMDRPMYLIGPKYYELYIQWFKWILPIAVTITLVGFFVGTIMAAPENQTLIIFVAKQAISEGIVQVLFTMFQVFFWLTLVFAVIERVDHKGHKPQGSCFKEWAPEDLKKITVLPKERAVPTMETVGRMIWTVIWVTVYFNADNILGIYKQGTEGMMSVTPSLNQDVLNANWLLVILAAILEIGLSIYKWKAKQWTIKLAWVNAISQIISLLLFTIIITSPNLFTSEYSSFLTNNLTFIHHPETFIIRIIIAVFLISIAADAYQGFKKAYFPVPTDNSHKKSGVGK
ncbi:hypothetical protein [Neobacillus dielmonensis]|uniref:hypothetical protein n=1 Tax=Neobacillus dielmonensis TaxID=1347369 RepID=UPI0005A6C95F|nr:hypothetical protein [Neobacillus dielmonensis]